jgi:hypothetical protein
MNSVIYQLRIQGIWNDTFSPSKHLGQRSDSVRKCNKRINKRTSILLKYVRSGSSPSWPQLRIRNCYRKLNFSLLDHPKKTTPAQRSTRKLLPLSHIWTIILYEIITAKVHRPSQPEHDTRNSGRPTQPQRSHTLADIKIDIQMFASVTPKVKKYLILINFLSSARFLTHI